jgi:hypothetical protein
MYRLLHRIFGWDYVAWENSCDQGISRINVSANGVVFFWRYKITHVADIIPNERQRLIWLTCSPDKYIKDGSNGN